MRLISLYIVGILKSNAARKHFEALLSDSDIDCFGSLGPDDALLFKNYRTTIDCIVSTDGDAGFLSSHSLYVSVFPSIDRFSMFSVELRP